MCGTSPTRSVNLSPVCCASGFLENIFIAIKKVVDQFNAWPSIQMMVCDTTSINTGRKNGVVTHLQRKFACGGLQKQQNIDDQSQVMDLILCHLINYNCLTASKKQK